LRLLTRYLVSAVNNNDDDDDNNIIIYFGRRTSSVTEDTMETMCLFQRLSVALQRGNAVSFLATFANSEM